MSDPAADRDIVLHVLDRLRLRYDDVFPHPECPAEVSIRRIDLAFDRLLAERAHVVEDRS